METPCRIDVHHHILPDVYRNALKSIGQDKSGGSPLPPWSALNALALMDRQGIAVAVASVSAPGVFFGDQAFARDTARACNDSLAGLVREHPTRFGALGILPLPGVDDALREIEHVFDTLRFDGVILITNAGGQYVGDKEWDAVMDELNRRRAVVLLHPNASPGDQPLSYLPPFVYDFTFDTTRAIANLIYSGTLERCSHLRIITAHAGGTAPYLRGRFEMAETLLPKLKESAPRSAAAYLQSLYYDTAISATPEVFSALRPLIEPAHILFGSDYPYLPEPLIAGGIAGTESETAFGAVHHAGFVRDHALALFPRLAAL